MMGMLSTLKTDENGTHGKVELLIKHGSK